MSTSLVLAASSSVAAVVPRLRGGVDWWITAAAGIQMLRPRPQGPQLPERRPRWVLQAVLVGVGAGLLTGLPGGGFVIVPALVLLLGLSISAAIGTSLLSTIVNSTAEFLARASSGSVDWTITLTFAIPIVIATASRVVLPGSFHRHQNFDRLRVRQTACPLSLLGFLSLLNTQGVSRSTV